MKWECYPQMQGGANKFEIPLIPSIRLNIPLISFHEILIYYALSFHTYIHLAHEYKIQYPYRVMARYELFVIILFQKVLEHIMLTQMDRWRAWVNNLNWI